MRRRSNILAVLLTVSATAACNAILGDFNATDGGAADASTDHTSDVKSHTDARTDGGMEASQVKLTAVATGSNVWVTETATVDGSKSTASSGKISSYAWNFTSVPSGSAIKNASLSSATADKPTFTPDVAGKYELELTVSEGTQKASAGATVTANAPQVFYNKANAGSSGGFAEDAGANSAGYWVGDFDGKNKHGVTCPNDLPYLRDYGNLGVWPIFSAGCLDFLEGEAGAPVQFAGFALEVETDAGLDGGTLTTLQTHLWAGTNNSACSGSPPTDLGVYPADASADIFAYGPRFSPDGKYVAFHDSALNIATVPVSGGAATIVDKYYASDPTGAALIAPFDSEPGLFGSGGVGSIVPSPAWHGTSVAWARAVDATTWEIVTAPNVANGPVSVYMKCPGITPREIAILNDGTVMVALRTAKTGPVNITLFKTDSSQNCSTVRTYSNLSDSAISVATAFSLSPDETQIAFTLFDPATGDASFFGGGITVGAIYTAPVDGSSPPTRVSNDNSIYGPRWVGGGRFLAFDKLGTLSDASPVPPISIVTLSPESGTEAVVETSDGVHTLVILSSSLSCSTTARPAGAGAFAFLSIILATRLAMRRRKRRP